MADGFNERRARETGCGCPADMLPAHFPECPQFGRPIVEDDDETPPLVPTGSVEMRLQWTALPMPADDYTEEDDDAD